MIILLSNKKGGHEGRLLYFWYSCEFYKLRLTASLMNSCQLPPLLLPRPCSR